LLNWLCVFLTESTFKAQAIRPAYIVLAGLGAANILLVIIAVIIICSYPIYTTSSTTVTEKRKSKSVDNNHHAAAAAAGSGAVDATDHEMMETSHIADVEANPYYHSDEAGPPSYNYGEDGDNHSGSGKVDDNPYFNESEIPKAHEDHESSGYNTNGPDYPYNVSAEATAAL